jgi:hypothetical protein
MTHQKCTACWCVYSHSLHVTVNDDCPCTSAELLQMPVLRHPAGLAALCCFLLRSGGIRYHKLGYGTLGLAVHHAHSMRPRLGLSQAAHGSELLVHQFEYPADAS